MHYDFGSARDEKCLLRQPIADIATTSSCLICAIVRKLLRTELERIRTAPDSQIALWRPFPTSETCESCDRWEEQQTTQEGQFVLPVFLYQSEADASPRIFLLELILRYDERRLVEVAAWDRSLIDPEPIKAWLADCNRPQQEPIKQGKNNHELEYFRLFKESAVSTMDGKLLPASSRRAIQIMPLEAGFQNRPVSLAMGRAQSKAGFHTECAVSVVIETKRLPPCFRVIDTRSRCLVSYEELEGCPDYVALSYTWASVSNTSLHLSRDTISELVKPGAISGQHLFADALDLCHSIGQHYLWVDKLCIVQDDPFDKSRQIEEMGNIYHGAVLTIVALTETNRGLPGASTRNPRLPNMEHRPASTAASSWQLRARRDPEDGASRALPPFLDKVAEKSTWETRGWTYQEKRLSKRLLFVSDQHVYTCCLGLVSGSQSNDVYLGYRVRFGGSYLQVGSAFEKNLKPRQGLAPFAAYAGAVEDYTKREHTLWSDRLDAFRGFGSLLDRTMDLGGIDQFYGLPRRHLAWSLFWSPLAPSSIEELERYWKPTSPTLPSWSWASTRGGVSYESPSEFSRPQDIGNIVTLYTFQTSCPSSQPPRAGFHEKLMPVREEMYWFDEVPSNEKSNEEKEALYARMIHQLSQLNFDEWKTCIHSPWEALKHCEIPSSVAPDIERLARTVPGALIFNTTCADLLLSTAPTPKYLGIQPTEAEEKSVEISILNHESVVVGYLHPWMPDTETATRAYSGLNKKDYYYRVIVISASLGFKRLHAVGKGSQTTDLRNGLHVLITEREGSGLLRRVAVGMVFVAEWNAPRTGAKWETVVLG